MRDGSHRRLVLGLLAALVAPGCAGQDEAPSRLVDGTEAAPPPVTLQGVEEPVVLSRAYAAPSPAFEHARRSCVQSAGLSASGVGAGVLRVGALGRSVTLEHGSGVYACDASGLPRETGEEGETWCGTSSGRLSDGRLRDPRLDVLCEADDGSPVAFAWVEPRAAARYVVVRARGYAEASTVVGALPVRVAATGDVDVDGARASFDVSEHDARGRLLRRYRLEAAVAG